MTKLLFAIYLLMLTWVILFKLEIDPQELMETNWRSINLIPFAQPLWKNGRFDAAEIIENIVAFVPFGIYLSMLRGVRLKNIVPIFLTSLCFEVLQYVLAIGSTDVTDVIANTLGGMTGIVIFAALKRLLGRRTNDVLNTAAAVCTALTALTLGAIVVYNM